MNYYGMKQIGTCNEMNKPSKRFFIYIQYYHKFVWMICGLRKLKQWMKMKLVGKVRGLLDDMWVWKDQIFRKVEFAEKYG
jgi:hypothetical protein